MFSESDEAKIKEWVGKLKVTRDDLHKTLTVTGYSNGAWACFKYGELGEYASDTIEMYDISSSMQYQQIITGVETPGWHEINAGWEVARAAVDDPLIELDMHFPLPEERINVHVALYLATKDRVDTWGGFTGEAEELPEMYAGLTNQERQAVDDRLKGLVVI